MCLEQNIENHLYSCTSRVQAIAIGQALVDGRWLECVSHHDQLFRDEYALYKPLQVKGVGRLKDTVLLGFGCCLGSFLILFSTSVVYFLNQISCTENRGPGLFP